MDEEEQGLVLEGDSEDERIHEKDKQKKCEYPRSHNEKRKEKCGTGYVNL